MRRSLDVFFSDSVVKFPDRPALVVGGRSWSYRDLDTERRGIETVLRTAGLAGRQSNIGLIYGRSVFTYAAILAIMRADCVYLPLNPKLPAERLLRILDDADIDTVIFDPSEGLSEAVMSALGQRKSLRVIVPEHCSSPIPGADHRDRASTRPPSEVGPEKLAYIIYTSGSTGVPKGVAITQASACSCIEKLHRLFETHQEDRFTQFSALSFDVSIADLFLCWKSGAALYVPDASEHLVPLNFVVRHAITIWSSVPSIANNLLKLRLLKESSMPSLRLILFAGEALPCELADACAIAAPNARIFNLYGPTECTIFATGHEHQSQGNACAGTVPIGVPLSGLHHMIMDDGRPVEEDNTPGELWIRGDQLAVGYWNNPTATEAAFVLYPQGKSPPTRWYRTGDLVSQKKSGVGLEFRGRLDRQVKLRGQRVELQEIESVLREVIGCTLVAVVPVHNAGGICEAIVAFCDRLTHDEGTIKNRCLERLPRYMVPDRVRELDHFPFSDHGKLDYRTLMTQAARRS